MLVSVCGAGGDVHDDVPHAKERLSRQRLSEEIGHVVRRLHEGNTQLHVLDALSNEEVAPVDVLSARVHLGVVSERERALVVQAKLGGRVVAK